MIRERKWNSNWFREYNTELLTIIVVVVDTYRKSDCSHEHMSGGTPLAITEQHVRSGLLKRGGERGGEGERKKKKENE